jgi:hypothetical protein
MTPARVQARPPTRLILAPAHARRAGQLGRLLGVGAAGGELAVQWADGSLGSYPAAWLARV